MIRPEQLEVLRRAARDEYIGQVARYLRDHFSARCAAMDDAELRAFARAAADRAATHGLTERYAVRQFAVLALVFGVEFDTAEEWAARLLESTSGMDQRVRARWLDERAAERLAAGVP